MKLALCISGLLRKIDYTTLNETFAHLNPDIYLHTWDSEYNTHLNKVKEIFPTATIKIEKYNDVFDNIRSNTDVDVFRYRFAQFYTVQQSFLMCAESNKQYDLIVRARTDLDIYQKQWELFDFQTFKKFTNTKLDTIRTHKFNPDNFPSKEDYEYDTIPWIMTKSTGSFNYYNHIYDFFWLMNSLTLTKLLEYTPSQLVQKAVKIFDYYSSSTKLNPVSPLIWEEIFKELDVDRIFDSLNYCTTRIIRVNNERELSTFDKHYGSLL